MATADCSLVTCTVHIEGLLHLGAAGITICLVFLGLDKVNSVVFDNFIQYYKNTQTKIIADKETAKNKVIDGDEKNKKSLLEALANNAIFAAVYSFFKNTFILRYEHYKSVTKSFFKLCLSPFVFILAILWLLITIVLFLSLIFVSGKKYFCLTSWNEHFNFIGGNAYNASFLIFTLTFIAPIFYSFINSLLKMYISSKRIEVENENSPDDNTDDVFNKLNVTP